MARSVWRKGFRKTDPLKIHFSPGERWDYSGEGYSYLQSVMTHLTGHVNPNDCRTFEDGVKVCATDFEEYMKANLFVPFGMTSSGYLYREGMARPHDEKGTMRGDRKATAVDAATAASIERKSAFIIMTNGDRGFDEIITKVVMSEPMQRFIPVTINV